MNASERQRLRMTRSKLLGRKALGAAGFRAQIARLTGRRPCEEAALGGRVGDTAWPKARIHVLHPRGL